MEVVYLVRNDAVWKNGVLKIGRSSKWEKRLASYGSNTRIIRCIKTADSAEMEKMLISAFSRNFGCIEGREFFLCPEEKACEVFDSVFSCREGYDGTPEEVSRNPVAFLNHVKKGVGKWDSHTDKRNMFIARFVENEDMYEWSYAAKYNKGRDDPYSDSCSWNLLFSHYQKWCEERGDSDVGNFHSFKQDLKKYVPRTSPRKIPYKDKPSTAVFKLSEMYTNYFV